MLSAPGLALSVSKLNPFGFQKGSRLALPAGFPDFMDYIYYMLCILLLSQMIYLLQFDFVLNNCNHYYDILNQYLLHILYKMLKLLDLKLLM